MVWLTGPLIVTKDPLRRSSHYLDKIKKKTNRKKDELSVVEVVEAKVTLVVSVLWIKTLILKVLEEVVEDRVLEVLVF